MRDFVEPSTFLDSVEQKSRKWFQGRSLTLRKQVVDNSNFLRDGLHFQLRNIDLKNLLKLIIVSWYIDEEVRVVLQCDLEQKIKQFELEDQGWLSLLLVSKPHCEIFLLETSKWHSRDFFGNILGKLDELDKFLKLRFVNQTVVTPQRKRGYNDHGSRADDQRWLPRFDWSFTKAQNEKEERLESLRDTISFLDGLIQ